MNITRAREILSRCSFTPKSEFTIERDIDIYRIILNSQVKNSCGTGTVPLSSYFNIPTDEFKRANTNSIVDIAERLAHNHYKHESMEWFKFDGYKWDDPHPDGQQGKPYDSWKTFGRILIRNGC